MTSFSPAVSWIPEKPGHYTTKMMVLESLDNPSALTPGLEAEFTVVGDMNALNENRSCGEEKELVFKINYKKAACVFPETLVKLLGRGWANWHDWYSPLFIDNLRQGPQDVGEVHAEFVKREVMKDSDVAKHFLRLKKYDYHCCGYLSVGNDGNPQYQLVINFMDLPNDKQLVVAYDLRQLKVVETKLTDMTKFGGPILEPEPEPSPEPEQMPEEERLHQEKQDQAKIQTQKEIMMVEGNFLLEDGGYFRHYSGLPTIPVEKLDVIFEKENLEYSIEGARLLSVTKIPGMVGINIVLEESQKGSLEITIPRDLIDARIGEGDDDFFVLTDGYEVPFTEITAEFERTLTIEFEEGTRLIEVIGTNPDF